MRESIIDRSVVPAPQSRDAMTEILRGGMDTLREAGVVLLGGHSLNDEEVKFGFAVTGLIRANKVVTNAGAKPGDALLLTKPLGMGIISTAIKRDLASDALIAKAVAVMTTLNIPPLTT